LPVNRDDASVDPGPAPGAGLTSFCPYPMVAAMVVLDHLASALIDRQIQMAGMHAHELRLTSVMGTCPPDADT